MYINLQNDNLKRIYYGKTMEREYHLISIDSI